MRIWLDDMRIMMPPFNIHIKNGSDCIKILSLNTTEFISFDHDLGDDSITGYDVAKWIEEQAFAGSIKSFKWAIHSANPVGSDNIRKAMEKADKYWNVSN